MSESNSELTRPSIDPHGVISVTPVAVAAPSDVDCVVHNLETGATYRLNDVGARVWELLEHSSTIADIVRTVRAEYQLPDDTSAEDVSDDITKIIGDLHQFGLVTLNEPA